MFSPYLTGNILRLRYKAQPVNAVAVYCENHTEHTDSLRGQILSTLMPKTGRRCIQRPLYPEALIRHHTVKTYGRVREYLDTSQH
jgi:hypothetical protein